MRSFLYYFIRITLLLVFSFGFLHPQSTEIPMRDFFKNPEKAIFQLSPDGNYISYVAPYEHRMNVYVQRREFRRSIKSLHVS